MPAEAPRAGEADRRRSRTQLRRPGSTRAGRRIDAAAIRPAGGPATDRPLHLAAAGRVGEALGQHRLEQLGVEDVEEILAIRLLGVIPESQAVLKASNQGVPVILDEQSDAGQAYGDAVDRLLGKEVAHRFLDVQKKGLMQRLFGGRE